jgi:hypothetical protein
VSFGILLKMAKHELFEQYKKQLQLSKKEINSCFRVYHLKIQIGVRVTIFVRFEVFTAVTMKSAMFRDFTFRRKVAPPSSG